MKQTHAGLERALLSHPPPRQPHEAIAMDGRLTCLGTALPGGVSALYAAMIALDDARTRKRSASVSAKERAVFDTVIANLYLNARCRDWKWSGFSTGNRNSVGDRTRYATPLQHRRQLRSVIDFLEGHGFIDLARGYMKPDRRTNGASFEAVNTKARATVHLIEFLEHFHGASPGDVIRTTPETILLRDSKDTDWWISKPGDLIDYSDTPATERMRAEMERINAHVAEAQVTMECDRPGHSVGDRSGTSGYRVFNNGTFDQGGRMYGWWWQNVPKSDRRWLRVRGEPVVEVDFQAMHLRLLYDRIGTPYPHDRDPFSPASIGIAGVSRDEIKLEFNRLVNRCSLPKRPTEKQRRIADAILHQHQPIARAFGSGAGLELMRIDSDIAVSVMMRLVDLRIPALPLHDGFLAREGDVEAVAAAMSKAYRSVVGGEAEPLVLAKAGLVLAA